MDVVYCVIHKNRHVLNEILAKRFGSYDVGFIQIKENVKVCSCCNKPI